MAGKIFISYRREDGAASAARLRDRLSGTFGAANVFMDVDNLLAGQRFDEELAKALASCDVFLAVIGPRWMDILKERLSQGGRDYVRQEIAAALARAIIVIPILVERATLPGDDALPTDIRDLVLHQRHEVAHERFGRDVEDLIAQIRVCRRTLRTGSRTGGRSLRSRALVGGLLALVLGAGVIAAYRIGVPSGLPWRQTEAASPAPTADATKQRAADDAGAGARAEEAERQRLAMLKSEEDVRRAAEAGRIRAALQHWQRFRQSGSTEIQASNDALIVKQLIDSCLAQVTSAKISDLDVSAAYTKANTVSQGQSWIYIPCRDARGSAYRLISDRFGWRAIAGRRPKSSGIPNASSC